MCADLIVKNKYMQENSKYKLEDTTDRSRKVVKL